MIRLPARPALRLLLAVCLVAGLGAGCAHAPHKPKVEMATNDILAYGKQAFENHEYQDAIEFLKGYVAREPTGEKADEAHFLLGQCYFHTQEWPSAATEFLIVTNEFAGSPHVPDAHYFLGLCYWKESRGASYDQDYTHRALDEFEHFLQLYPDHPRAEEVKRARAEARARLAEKAYNSGKLYLKLGYYSPAREYFEKVQSDFADTPWYTWAILGEALTWAKQHEWEQSNAVLEKLSLADPPPPAHVASEAKKLASYVKGRLVASRGGASPAAAP